MTDYAPMPVAGYTSQTEQNIALVNQAKRMEEHLLQHLDRLKESPDIDQRWLAMGRTHIEQGFMFMNRAVFKPKRFKGDAT
jgi:hypothetical protein